MRVGFAYLGGGDVAVGLGRRQRWCKGEVGPFSSFVFVGLGTVDGVVAVFTRSVRWGVWLVDGRQCVRHNISTSGRSIRGTVGGVSGNVFPRTFYGVVPSVLNKSPRCYGVVRTSNTNAGSSLTCLC